MRTGNYEKARKEFKASLNGGIGKDEIGEKRKVEMDSSLHLRVHNSLAKLNILQSLCGQEPVADENEIDISKAPGQWKRLIAGVKSGLSDDQLFDKDQLQLDAGEWFSAKEGRAQAYIIEVANYFSDSIPALQSEKTGVNIRVVPYRTIKDMHKEYVYQCESSSPVITKAQRASYATFVRAWRKLHSAELVRLMGGKGSFQTCAICNHCIAIKKTAQCKRDLVTIEVIRKISRLHLLQQQTERQHAENVLHDCKTKYKDGEPVQAFIDIDGQTTGSGNTPKYSKLYTSAQTHFVENRNIGVRLVCGPIDKWISISTNNLLPGGANILIEASKIALEVLAELLGEVGLTLPKILFVQYDNSTENKVILHNIYIFLIFV
jgi:hypothetical protein